MYNLTRIAVGLLFFALLLFSQALKAAFVDESEAVTIDIPLPTIAAEMPVTKTMLSPSPSPTVAPQPNNAQLPEAEAASAPEPDESPAPSWPLKTFKYKPAGYTIAGNVNLREGPGTEYAIIRKLSWRAPLTMLAESGDWYYVSTMGVEGFVSKEFATVGTATTPKPSPQYSEDEVYLAAQMIYLEAKGGTYEEFQAIAAVLANRIASQSFPNTIEGNIFAPGQFTVADDMEWFLAQKPSKDAIRAADSVLNDREYTFEKSVMYFRAKRLGTEWKKREYYKTIGNHCFFK